MPHRQNKKKHIGAKSRVIEWDAATTSQGYSSLTRTEFEQYARALVAPSLVSAIAGEATRIRAYSSPTLNRMYEWAISSMDGSNVTVTTSVS